MSDHPVPPSARVPYTTGSVTSRDGTVIGYRQFGRGPGLVALHGGMQAAQNFTRLAGLLADTFTVSVPDRRGRGRSGPPGSDYSLDTESDDVRALFDHTGARYIFGLSSGALIALRAALRWPSIERAALYEPPLSIDGSVPMGWGPRFDQEIARGDVAGAMVTALRATGEAPAVFRVLPKPLLSPLLRLAMKGGAKGADPGDVPIRLLVPTMHFDHQLVKEAADTLPDYATVSADVLLIGGDRSAAYLQRALTGLDEVLPRVRRVELSGVGHLAADNDGRPELVARELRDFFPST